MALRGWIGVDFDATLVEYHGWKGAQHIGAPIAPMVDRVKAWLTEGREVRIFTARAYAASEQEIGYVQEWCREHLGQVLAVTCVKDRHMIELWDDRAVQVEPNTGRRADGRP